MHSSHNKIVEAAVRERNLFNIALVVGDLREACSHAQALRLFTLRIGHVESMHPPLSARLDCSDETIHSAATAQVEHTFLRRDGRQVKVETHTGEGVHGLMWDPVQIRWRIAQLLRKRAPHCEVKLPERLLRHLAVDLLHFGFEVSTVHALCCCRRHDVPPSFWVDQDDSSESTLLSSIGQFAQLLVRREHIVRVTQAPARRSPIGRSLRRSQPQSCSGRD